MFGFPGGLLVIAMLYVIAFIVDITERKIAEQELLQKQEQLKRVSEDIGRRGRLAAGGSSPGAAATPIWRAPSAKALVSP